MVTATDIIAVSFGGLSLLASGWAGWTAHKARVWQEQRDEERRATKVRVEFHHRLGQPEDMTQFSRFSRVVRAGGLEVHSLDEAPNVYWLTLTAINDGESSEYVTRAVIETPPGGRMEPPGGRMEPSGGRVREGIDVPGIPFLLDPRGGTYMGKGVFSAPPGAPYELRPRAVLEAPVQLDDLEVETFSGGVVGTVYLASGAQVTTGVEMLVDRYVEQHTKSDLEDALQRALENEGDADAKADLAQAFKRSIERANDLPAGAAEGTDLGELVRRLFGDEGGAAEGTPRSP